MYAPQQLRRRGREILRWKSPTLAINPRFRENDAVSAPTMAVLSGPIDLQLRKGKSSTHGQTDPAAKGC